MSSVSYAEQVREELRLRDAPKPVDHNPTFISESDTGGEGTARAMREAARFQQRAKALVTILPAVEPKQAVVKAPWIRPTKTGYTVEVYEISGAVELQVQRPGTFKAKLDLTGPSVKLAAFVSGERSEAWEARDDDIIALTEKWANMVKPDALAARAASKAIGMALAARAGIKITSLDHVGPT